MDQGILQYNDRLTPESKAICDFLAQTIDEVLPKAESKIWHAHPVWFLNGNPVAGYSQLKSCVRLLFWSGQSFDEPLLIPEGKFKAAEMRYHTMNQLVVSDLKRWIEKSSNIQWDYKNIVKRKGVLLKIS